MSLVERMINRARATPASVVLPESEDERILAAATRLTAEGIAHVVLTGNKAQLRERANRLGLSLDGCDIVDTGDPDRIARYAALYSEGRDRVKPGMAERAMHKPLYFAAMMVSSGDVDAYVAGIANPTKRVLEAAQLCIGLAEGIQIPSGCFVMAFDDASELIFADCAVNIDPSGENLADIAIASAATCSRLLDVEPRVAMLSFSTKGSGSHARADKVRQAVDIIRERAPGLRVDGELQADTAISARVASAKLDEPGDVAGRANVLIFPNLDAGNIGYKLVQQFAGAKPVGPILQGFARPVADLSRGATVDEIVATVAATVVLGSTS